MRPTHWVWTFALVIAVAVLLFALRNGEPSSMPAARGDSPQIPNRAAPRLELPQALSETSEPRTSPAQPVVDEQPEIAVPTPDAPPTRREQLRVLLTDFDKAMLGPHDEHATSRAQMALCGSIATLLDAAGRWRDAPKTSSPDAPSVRGRGFMIGSRIYELADDEFPEYDVLTAHLTALAELRQASVPGAAPPELPRFDPGFIHTVRARVEEAIAIARN